MSDEALQTARQALGAGDNRSARDAALGVLQGAPDDVEALRIAGRAGVELGLEEAEGELRRVTELTPDDPDAWRDLGDALAAAGRTDEAGAAFQRVLEQRPDDALALAHLGHAAAAAGNRDEGISYLARAVEHEPHGGGSSAIISLVEMYRAGGDLPGAFAAAKQAAAARPDDVAVNLDVAELALELDQLDEAQAAFEHVREIDDVADHEVYTLHGLAHVALRRGDAREALRYAVQALPIDELGRTADLVSHLQVETGDDLLAGRASSIIQRVPPTREELEGALMEALREHRRLHADDRLAAAGEAPLG